MNLATLWAHERARVCATQQHAPRLDAGDHADERHAIFKRQPGTSSPASATTPTTGGAVKKKVSTVIRRESVYSKLVEESALPLAEQAVGDANEFAMEYADRVPRRFVQLQAQQQPHHAADTNGNGIRGLNRSELGGCNSEIITDPSSSPLSKPLKRKNSSLLQPVTGAVPTPKATTPAAAPTVSNPPRRNPKKRGNGNSLELAPQAFKPYVGDMFGTRGDYIEGMLYMSRMKRSHRLTFGRDGVASDFAPARGVLKDAVTDALSAAVAAAATGNLNGTVGESMGLGAPVKGLGSNNASSAAALLSEISPEEILQLRQRQRCSLTLSNWSSNPENARLMVQENVVDALILLCKASDDDRVTKLNSVTTFMNLSHVDELRSDLVQQGAVKTLVEIASDTDDDKTLRTACAVTLCNLCCCLEGEEEILVEDGAVSALSLLINEHPKTAAICLGALYNLTCVKEPYHKIESVMKVFATLASSTPPSSSSASSVERDEIIAKAICNLSNFKRVRLRLMEEGIVAALSNLIHPNHSSIQQLLAYVFLNLSAMRACRSELVAKGCLGALKALSDATAPHDSETKCIIALSLWNLSKEPSARLRMVFEGFLLLVNELCRGGTPMDLNSEAVRTVCARTVYNVSCSEDTRLKLVERDAVTILSTLAQRCVGDEGKKMCTLSLCNLLSVQQAASDIVSAGAITSLIELSMVSDPQQTLETRHLFAQALYGLCEMATTRAAVVQAGIIPAIIHLSSISVPLATNGAVHARQANLLSDIRARCTAALACLAGDDALASTVCTPDVAHCVVEILVQERVNVVITRFCCSCLSLLCRDEQCALFVAAEGALKAVLATCLESQDTETKASCCHVLASMSCHRSCCMALVDMGALPVLTTLAKTGMSKSSGAMVQRCCAITLANLSAEQEIRTILVTSSIVPLLSLLSNSYSEDSQRDCARVLCNLSTVKGHEAALVQGGALGVLMMISMVRALQPATKETCVRAFANLLTAATARPMVNEGIVKVLPVFAGLAAATVGTTGYGDVTFASSVIQTVSVIFAKLLRYEEGRQALKVESTALRSLISLRPSQEEEEGTLYESLLGDVLYYDELRERSVVAGIVESLHQLATQRLAGGKPVSRIALMLFALAKHDNTRQAAASESSLSTLGAFLASEGEDPSVHIDKETILYSVSTVCHLAWHDSTRIQLNPHDITQPLTRLLRLAVDGGGATPSELTISTCLLTLCSLSDCSDHLNAMLQEDIVTHLLASMELTTIDTTALLSLVCILFRQLSHVLAFEASLTKVSSLSAVAIKLFCLLANRAAAENDHHAALDCADTLCSITFLRLTASNDLSANSRPLPTIRRQSQTQHERTRGSMAVASSVPPAALISSEVLEAICALVNNESRQWAETRWRCMAALYAFSCITAYRHTLVRLGCSRLLVHEAARATASTSAVELATLRCCAGALCNLTIVSGAHGNINAQIMIEEDAVPALIHLAKRENDEIREYCTLALSNLSTQSPKVESGAVSALLSLSLQVGSSVLDDADSHGGVSRPPLVVNARYREFSSLPDHGLQLELQDEVLDRKYEAAQGHASKPPPPHLPVLSPDYPLVGGRGRNSSSIHGVDHASANGDGPDAPVNREEVIFRRRRSSSIGDMLGVSAMANTPASSRNNHGSNGGLGGDGDLRGWRTLAFPKIDPAEIRALNMEIDGASDPADTDDALTTATSDAHAALTGGELSQADDEVTDTVSGDIRSESDESSAKTRARASPLAQLVVRKSQTSHAVSKLKGLKTPHSGVRSGATMSTSSLPLATVEEAQETSRFSHSPSSRRLNLVQSSTPKVHALQKLGTSKSLQTLSSNSVVSALTSVGETILAEPPSAIAAAAAAALLYAAGPAPAPVPKPKAHSDAIAKKAKSKPATSTRHVAAEDEAPRPLAPVVTSIQDVQAQVKLLGLWN